MIFFFLNLLSFFLKKKKFSLFFFFRICQICERHLDEAVFARFPNGIIAHLHCIKENNISDK